MASLPGLARAGFGRWPVSCLFALAMVQVLVLGHGASSAETSAPQRIISVNMCTDQLLLDLARPEQVLGLSPYARDAVRSWAADKFASLPILSGTAEEIMVLKPDLVVSSRFTRRTTLDFIRAQGVRLEEFGVANSLVETRAQIARFGEITGAPLLAAQRIADLDAAADALRDAARVSGLRVLPLARRGWVAGRDSLMSDLLTQAGLVNAGSELGLSSGGFLNVEAIVRLRPDAILVSRDDGRAEDQGRAMLLHPAILALFPPERRIILPERLTVCGGPMLAVAMRELAGQISRLKPRDQPIP